MNMWMIYMMRCDNVMKRQIYKEFYIKKIKNISLQILYKMCDVICRKAVEVAASGPYDTAQA